MNPLDVAVRFVVAMLLEGLWQIPLFALAAWCVLRVAATTNATTRHTVLAAALYASLLLPAATAALTLDHGGARTPVANDAELPKGARSYVPVRQPPSPRIHMRRPVERLTLVADAANIAAGASPARPSFIRSNISLPRWAALVIAAFWLGGAGLALARLAASLLHLESLKRDALPLSVAYRAGLPRWSAAVKGGRDVRLCTSDAIDIPIAVGLLDAMILLPARLLEELPPRDVDAIVLHELAHLRRADDYINAAERVALALLFFHPAVRWIASRLDLKREVACDDWVLLQNDALPYATCLARIAEVAMWPHRAMPAPGAFVTRRGISVRIERLLAKHRDVRIRTSFGSAASVVGLIAVVGMVGALVSPLVAYDDPQVPASPPASPAPPAHVAHLTHAAKAVHAAPSIAPAATVPAAPIAPIAPAAPTAPAAPAPPTAPAEPSVSSKSRAAKIAATAASPASAPAASPSATSIAVVRVAPAPFVPQPAASALEPSAPRPSARFGTEAGDLDYVDTLAAAGYSRLSVDDLMTLKAVGVNAAYIRDLQRAGLAHPSVDELTSLRALGVTPDYVRDLMRARYPHFTSDDIAGFHALGIDGEFIRRAVQHGFADASAEQLMRLKAIGVL